MLPIGQRIRVTKNYNEMQANPYSNVSFRLMSSPPIDVTGEIISMENRGMFFKKLYYIIKLDGTGELTSVEANSPYFTIYAV